MKQTRYKIKIEVQVLSLDSAPAIINEMTELIGDETVDGKLQKEDGDLIEWETNIKQVECIGDKKATGE